MKRIQLVLLVSFFLYACGGPALQKTVRYARLSVNTVMVGAQEADEVNAAFFEETSERISQEAYEEVVKPVAEEYGLEGEGVCEMTLPVEVVPVIKDACDKGYATWCKDIKPVWTDHCLRTCIVATTKDGLREAEQIVNDLQYVQEQYSADSTFKQLKEQDGLKWNDYLGEVWEWFGRAVKHLGKVVHLFHEADVDIPPALYTVVDVAGNFKNIPENTDPPACDCAEYPPDSDCTQVIGLLNAD